jgi:hypothetical protein
MYIIEIISYLLWPLLIWVSWLLVGYFLKMYERNRREAEE